MRHLTLILILALAFSSAVGADTESNPEACQLTLSPNSIAASEDSVEVHLEGSASLGTLHHVEAQEESGIRIVEVRADEHGGYQITIDVSAAAPGTWTLELSGEGGACMADLTVAATAA